MLALGFYIDSTACADAIYELVRLSAQNFFAIAANDLVGCFVVVCNALQLVIALGLGSHAALAPLAQTRIAKTRRARLSLVNFAANRAEAAMGQIAIGSPCAAFTGMVIRSKSSGGNAHDQRNDQEHSQ